MRNIIQNCLDFDAPMSVADRANMFLDHIFSQPPSRHYLHMLMGLCDQILNMQHPLRSYAQFFTGNDVLDDKTTSFTTELKQVFYNYQYLPKNGYLPQLLIFFTPEMLKNRGFNLMNSDSSSLAIDIISQLDREDTNEKLLAVSQYYVDLRNLILRPKMEKIFGFYGVKDRKHKILQTDESYSEFDLTRLFMAINAEYGEQIEKQLEIQHCIDHIFDQNWYITK